MLGPFCLILRFVLTLASDMAILHGNDTFSILVLSNKKWYSCYLNEAFVFQKISFKVKVLKTFKLFTDCHIKTCRSFRLSDGGYFENP